jgi:hypothetical protein
MPDEDDTRVTRTSDQTSGGESGGSTLLPMLLAGLILIVIGATVIVLFV